ncbi:MAG: hypothetical protein ACREON_16340 [Gemmatimonadaceae bacterium]
MRYPLVSSVEVQLSGPAAAQERIRPLLPRVRGARVPSRAVVELAVSEGDLHVAGAPLFQQPGVSISVAAEGGLVATSDGASALIRERRVELRMLPAARRGSLQPVFDVSWPLLLPALGMFHVHGAAVRDPAGTGWLMAGDANIGKSTTTLSLVRCGWSYAADDAVYLSLAAGGEILAEGWEEPIRLTDRSARALSVTRQVPDTELKSSALLDEPLAGRRVDHFYLQRLLLPELGPVTKLIPVSAHDALAALVRASAWIVCLPRLGNDYLRLLGKVASLPAARLVLGPELLDDPAILAGALLRLADAA